MSVQDTRLLVLGVVKLREPTYGYEIEKELKRWNADRWAGIARASIYHQLKALTKAGLLEFESTGNEGKRPTQYRYRTTKSGREQFSALLRQELNKASPQPGDLMAALCFTPSIPQDEWEDSCRRRLGLIDLFLASFDEEMNRWFPTEAGKADYIQEIFYYEQAAFTAERQWLTDFLERLPSYYPPKRSA
ncbi:hypothetical protein CRD60_02420 [Bifidobacterium aemilianum]|uniref:Transcription regulator PadR N-terminal domain-containing protein n=1 Tax=Bifidobacterium aemilianum TaxID=2493120 RepID=A0A366KA74_9BIFI|nr:PadR family transcriptional regulator [Bifidobacterium aemilianum]RBP98048.1 hypothetical protein CRD60_02420 [Bifidobacterium aemilianum]